jgi:hypothetical protein
VASFGDGRKELIKLDKVNPTWSQQTVTDEFNKLHRGKSIKKNTISQMIKSSTQTMKTNLDIV